MQDKLTWNAIGYEHKFKILLDNVNSLMDKLPENHTRDLSKLNRFKSDIDSIISKCSQINNDLIPRLEKQFRIHFKTPELVLIAFTRPSIRHLIEIIETHFENENVLPFSKDDFEELASSGDAANVLALIGDSVLDLAIVKSLWDSSLAKVGDLSKKRSTLVSNKNLAKFCDQYQLYDFRIFRLDEKNPVVLKDDTVIHEKGTLVEALFGVIYLEYGLEELGRIIPFLQ